MPVALSEKELKIVRMVAEGYSNSDVAEVLSTTYHMVKNYMRILYDKTGMFSRLELALWWLEHQHEYGPDCRQELYHHNQHQRSYYIR